MANKTAKFEKLVVCALKKLQDLQGSSPKEITDYLSQEYDVPSKEIRKQVRLALRRGVSYGILQRNSGGTYVCNKEFIKDPNSTEVTEPCPWMKFGRKSKSSGKSSGRKGRKKSKSKSKSRSKKSRSKKGRRRGKKAKKGKSLKGHKARKTKKGRKKSESCLVYLRVDKNKLARKKSKTKKRSRSQKRKSPGC
ncbi:splicing factor, arginine/serine-rich 19-like [Microplitis mediator]|uniref:splicing factor, arginine/serine-rich 19-like n=1 Tax=Microplitis mediator TaxID=375433 RepID=UPI0025526710|nr:splicing factor, arginine/serine-rich 19-like [Microplitis mediator]